MLFHSLGYVCLLLLTILVSSFLPANRRWLALLAASITFYGAWRLEYLGLLLLTAVSCHYAAQFVEGRRDTPTKQRLSQAVLAATLCFNLLVLFLFKYYDLFQSTVAQTHVLPGLPDLNLLLPVGISFYTFQAIGYVVDVSKGKLRAESNLARTCLFISFFPQLVAGPIERASRLFPALAAPIHFRWRKIRIGLWLLCWGLFKKVVLADRLSLLVDFAYEDPTGASGGLLLLATYAFAFQIYCDFSGYTDMALGSAKIFGIDLMDNFRVPYLATSVREFWARWHISLSTWFRDYVYIPMGGNRLGLWRWILNLLVVFAASGLWHGAQWTFVVWGLIHGGLVAMEVLLHLRSHSKSVSKPHWIRRFFGWSLTFHVVLLAWIFFRAENLDSAWQILMTICSNPAESFELPVEFSKFELVVASLALIWLHLVEVPCQGQSGRVLGWRPRWKARLIVIGTLLLIVNFGIFNHPKQFVYFQF